MPSQATIGRFFKHSSIYAIGNILNRVGAFLLLPLYTGYLSVGQYGSLELFYSIYAVISGVLGVGIAHATLRFYFDSDDQPSRYRVVSTNFWVSLLISSLGVALVAPFTGQIMGHFFPNAGFGLGFYFLLASVVFELSSQVLLAYLRAIEKSWLFVIIVLVKLVIQVAINTYLIVFQDQGVEGALIGNSIAVFVGWLILACYCLPKTGLWFSVTLAGHVLRYSFPFLLSTLVSLVSTNVDKFLINSMLGLEALGVYALALKLAQVVEALVGEPFSRAYGSYRFSIMDEPNASQLQASIVKIVLIGAVVAGLGIGYFSYEVLMLFSQPEFLAAVNYIPILILGYIARIFIYSSQTGILVQKKTQQIFYISAAAAVVSVVANLSLIYWFALLGVCIAQLVTHSSALAITHRVSNKFFPVKYAWPQVGAVLMIFVLFSALGILMNGLPIWQTLSAKTLLIMAAFYLLYRYALASAERDQVVKVVYQVGQRLFGSAST